ncbi:hypothetical protein D9M68_856670 [compost metagenome]
MAEELAEYDLAAPDGIAKQQQHGAAFDLANDGIVRDQKRNQRHQKDRQARQADDHHVEAARPDIAGGCASKKGQRQRECGEDQCRRKNPAVAHALANFLGRYNQNVAHYAASRLFRK